MRVLGMIGLAGSVVLVSSTASAGGRHGGDDSPTVRDHRSHDSDTHDAPVVRDHRTHDDGPTVRDHRTHDDSPSRTHDDGPVVRDHRTHDDGPTVRDHRGDDDVYFASSGDDVIVTDGGGGGGDPFANLSGPTWSFELGGFAQRFRGPRLARNGSVETVDGYMADYGLASGTPAAGDTAGGAFEMRFTVQTSEHLYAGAELGIGGLTRSPVELMSDSRDDIHISSRSLIVPAAVLGVRARHGIAELDGEVAGGARILSTTVGSYDAGEDDPSETETALSGLLEARLRGVVWVSPHVYLAAQAGVGVLERSDLNIGLAVGLSSRPLGRAR